MGLYNGFSSQKFLDTNGKTFKITDIECVQRDIMNHIFTSPGQRIGMPTWGTRIPLMTFEILDDTTKQIIIDDITMVMNYDPRVELIELQPISSPDSNTLMVYVDVLYVEFAVTGTLNIAVPMNGTA
jgi:phage baseplate assembly protein W